MRLEIFGDTQASARGVLRGGVALALLLAAQLSGLSLPLGFSCFSSLLTLLLLASALSVLEPQAKGRETVAFGALVGWVVYTAASAGAADGCRLLLQGARGAAVGAAICWLTYAATRPQAS